MILKIINIFKHTRVVLKHKWVVFKLCCKIGIPWRGFLHDFSKFSPEEFWESVKYFNGHKSPIIVCKMENGYSKAWLHHKGRNKHHPEYWTDLALPEQAVIMPYKYSAEMVCDKMAAGIVYEGKNWTPSTEINYYMKERENELINPQMDKFMIEVFTQVEKEGLNKTFTKQNIKKIYNKYCSRTEKLDENKVKKMGKTRIRSKQILHR